MILFWILPRIWLSRIGYKSFWNFQNFIQRSKSSIMCPLPWVFLRTRYMDIWITIKIIFNKFQNLYILVESTIEVSSFSLWPSRYVSKTFGRDRLACGTLSNTVSIKDALSAGPAKVCAADMRVEVDGAAAGSRELSTSALRFFMCPANCSLSAAQTYARSFPRICVHACVYAVGAFPGCARAC